MVTIFDIKSNYKVTIKNIYNYFIYRVLTNIIVTFLHTHFFTGYKKPIVTLVPIYKKNKLL